MLLVINRFAFGVFNLVVLTGFEGLTGIFHIDRAVALRRACLVVCGTVRTFVSEECVHFHKLSFLLELRGVD